MVTKLSTRAMRQAFSLCLIALLAACSVPAAMPSTSAVVTANRGTGARATATPPLPAPTLAAPDSAQAVASPPADSAPATTAPSSAPSMAAPSAAPAKKASASRSALATAQPVTETVPLTVPAFSHVFVIIMENHEASQIVGNQGMPYLNHLADQYARAANYFGVTHPSLPNYLALIGGDTFGVTSDCLDCFVNADNLAAQLDQAKRSWKAYMEDMPQPCFTGTTAGNYAQRHDPFIYFDNIRTDPARCQKIVPLTQLQTDLAENEVPDFAWITPNVCNDMHDCPAATGDAFLQTWVPKILASPAWRQDGVLFILFDEGTTAQGCCQYARGGHIDALVISPLGRPGYVSRAPYDHYSFLRTVEESWGLPLLGHAGSNATLPMSDFFAK